MVIGKKEANEIKEDLGGEDRRKNRKERQRL